MPIRSAAQGRLIFAKAAQGVPWAIKYLKDSGYGDDIPKRRRRKKKRHAPLASRHRH